jgi:hypothetical protein
VSRKFVSLGLGLECISVGTYQRLAKGNRVVFFGHCNTQEALPLRFSNVNVFTAACISRKRGGYFTPQW